MATKQWNPGDLLEISGYYWKTALLHAAVKLDVFTVIGDRQLAASEISRQLDATQRGLVRLLDALVAMELLVKKDGLYANSPSGQTFLSKKSAQYIGHIMMHHYHLVESWSKLDQAVQSGLPVRGRSSFSKEEWRESFLMGMFNLAMGLAPHLVPQVDISTRKHLLDLGGGPGTYAIHFCLNNPGLRAEVYDLPTTRPFAEKTIRQFDLSHRIKFADGNYLTESIQGHYDVAWLSHILHGEGPEECRQIIQKAVDALEPQGTIIIHEFILNNSMDGPLFPALFSLNMLLGTDSGQSYSEQQLTDMLLAAGVTNIRRIPIKSPNDSGLLIGEK
ncbi:O-methyltransferase [Olavius algarvensis Delta 1 endosymbiont]|nr:O-methyltransferase [Olavius algarvensis Delta 1 endosymbiont]